MTAQDAAPSATQNAAQATAPSGGVVVPAEATTPGSVVLVRGPVDVYGTVRGDVLTIAGDVVVHPGARVEGSAASLFGRATRLDVPAQPPPATPAGPPALAAALGAPLGWFLLLAVLGAAAAARLGRQLHAVREAVERRPAQALGAGVAGQLLVLPALVILVAAFCATIVGVVAVPLAVVLYAVAVAGLASLGFLAVAAVVGRAVLPRARLAAVRSPVPALGGLALFLALWLVAGAATQVPALALAAHALAAAATWTAATAGFGAALLTRAGTRVEGRARRAAASDTLVTERGVVPAWQTPTPIATLAAARPRAAQPTAVD